MLIRPPEFLILTLCLAALTPVCSSKGLAGQNTNPPEQERITTMNNLPDTPAAAPNPQVSAQPQNPADLKNTAEPENSAESPNPTEPQPLPIPEKTSLVRVKDYIPDILVDLKYATEDNFTGQTIYTFTDAYLRYGTIEKLKLAQEAVKEYGMCLKIWDGYRPVSAQFKLWEICPDSTYVANPNRGYSSHSRGNTIDITLVYADGAEVEMPTGFDDFSAYADRDYRDCTRAAAEHALLLENIMKNVGFQPYFGEWWHFSDTTSYPVEENFEP